MTHDDYRYPDEVGYDTILRWTGRQYEYALVRRPRRQRSYKFYDMTHDDALAVDDEITELWMRDDLDDTEEV